MVVPGTRHATDTTWLSKGVGDGCGGEEVTMLNGAYSVHQLIFDVTGATLTDGWHKTELCRVPWLPRMSASNERLRFY